MRLLVPAASAAFIAAGALSATAAVHAAGPRPAPVSSSRVSSAHVGAAQNDKAHNDKAHNGAAHNARITLTGAAAAAAVAPANTAQLAPRGPFAWPLSPQPTVLRRFEPPRTQWSAGHRGVDLLAAVGQPVLSAGDGIVAFSGVIAGRGVITVRHSGGLRTTYEPVDERLASGTVVHRTTRIGVVSPTPGHCLPHQCLHWGAISGQTYRDPLSLLGFGRPILLPLP
jgi:murein DD-endopeptidase MepM/ murein hydrolase activator NlpD